MSLPGQQPLIPQGWIRAVLLFIAYVGLSLAAGYYITSADAWFMASFVLAFLLVFLFRKFVDRKTFGSLGLNTAGVYPDAITGLSLGIFLLSSGTLIIYFLNGIEWIDITGGAKDLYVSLGTLLLIAVSEELVFRGYILRNLMKSFNQWVALVFSALLFTAVHVSNPGVPVPALINTFLGGLLLGITFMGTRNLWLPVFFHFSWNFMQGPVLGYPVSGINFHSILVMQTKGDVLISGGAYGFEGSLICSAMLLLAVLLWILLRGIPGRPQPAAVI